MSEVTPGTPGGGWGRAGANTALGASGRLQIRLRAGPHPIPEEGKLAAPPPTTSSLSSALESSTSRHVQLLWPEGAFRQPGQDTGCWGPCCSADNRWFCPTPEGEGAVPQEPSWARGSRGSQAQQPV